MRPDWRKFPHQWLHEATDLNSTEKLTWLTLNDHQGNNAKSWPSQETLAKEVGVSIRTIERTVRTLEQKGYLFKRRTKLFGPQRNDYQVCHPSHNLFSYEADIDVGYVPDTVVGSKPTLVSGYSLENSPRNSPREPLETEIQNQNCNCGTNNNYHETDCSGFGALAEVNEV